MSLYIPFVIFVMLGTTNAVNLTDGIDDEKRMAELLQEAVDKNIVVVTIAGNNGGDCAEFWPAQFKNGITVAQDGMDSFIARAGFAFGKDIKDGNIYARASYLYDFDGETKAVLNGIETLKNDLGGSWWEVGIGANINLSKATYVYADVEKTFGGEVDTNWQWNLGVRYSF